jgi:hypothetical protein
MKRRAGEEVSQEFVAQFSSFLEKTDKKASARQSEEDLQDHYLFHL